MLSVYRSINSIWNAYKRRVQNVCTDQSINDNDLRFWRNYLFALTITYLVPFSIIAFIPGVYMAWISDLYFLLAADLFAIITIGVIIISRRLTVRSRKLLLGLALYLVSIALLYSLGSYGPGLLYLLAITLFLVLIFEQRIACWSVYINTAICVLFGLFIYYGFSNSIIISEYEVNSWIAVSSNLIFLSAVAVLLIPNLFEGLQNAFNRHVKLENKLKIKQTQLEVSLSELEKKNKELEEFAYVTSHDLKEPLRTIRNFLKLIDKKHSGQIDKRGKEYIRIAVEGAEKMTTMIDDLLQYSRVGGMKSIKSDVDLNDVLHSLRPIFEYKEADKNPELRFAEMPVVYGVPISMRLLFQNLISNGLKYQDGNEEAVIEIKYEEKEEYWQFAVTDNGIGIDKKYTDQIFQMFKRLHLEDEFPGTGMGLAICKKIVEQHGGTIWVESEEGKGSAFYFTIQKNTG